MYKKRFYRDFMKGEDLIYYNVCINETDLCIGSKPEKANEVRKLVIKYRSQIESYIYRYPIFLTSLVPVKAQIDADEIVAQMCDAASVASVGPMAAVAGAISQMVGIELMKYSKEVIIENGGDIFINVDKNRIIGIYAGDKSAFNCLGIKVTPQMCPVGICTSSGTLGHSLSFGKSDATIVVSKSAIKADALATSIGNKVKTEFDIEKAIDYAKTVDDVLGVIIIVNDKIGLWGNIEICKI
jgi:ApbE superfamily uncharacterized protein (UPF0280 family)